MLDAFPGTALDKPALIARWQRIRSNIQDLAEGRPVRLVAVSKYSTDAHIECLAEAGQTDFAESRPQQLRDRAIKFPDLVWHMIGPVQKNKAKYVARHASLWHSACDLDTVNAVATHLDGKILPTFLQVNVSTDPTRLGVPGNDVSGYLKSLMDISGISLHGLMCMLPQDDEKVVALISMREIFSALSPALPELSMGMSGDYEQAIAHGSTMVRIGRELFDG